MSLRALHVLESLAAGGMETTFLNMLTAFRGENATDTHDVLAFAGGALEPRYRDVTTRLTIACDTPTIASCFAEGYDVVHILFERCAYRVLPTLLARYTTPVVYGKGYDMGGMYRLNEGLDWTADVSMLSACDGVTFTTPALAAGFPAPQVGPAFRRAGNDTRTTTLRKAADIRTFAALERVNAHTPQRIVCVANLHPRKRLGDLIVALASVRCQVPDAELRFVGGGNSDEKARLVRMAAHAGVADVVTFAGQVADVADEIAQARVMALPSSCEGVPTALLEAMAAARPVVAARVGHIQTIVDEGLEGFLIEVGDVTALADRLVQLLTNPDLAHRMGAAARTRAERHDVTRVAADLLGVLRAAAGSQASAVCYTRAS